VNSEWGHEYWESVRVVNILYRYFNVEKNVDVEESELEVKEKKKEKKTGISSAEILHKEARQSVTFLDLNVFHEI
jgi:hypothetical protein